MNVTTTINVPADSSFFEGHFPGRPILPGVAEIVLALEVLASETSRDLSLRRICYTRLRQIVLPGEHLDLTAKSLEGGSVRIELKRDGAMVANGEWEFGVPDSVDEVVSLPASPGPLADIPPLDTLLPHRPPMRFLQSILSEKEGCLTCVALIPSACALVNRGGVPAVVGLEVAAQAAAAWEALQRSRVEGAAEPRIGYLVALREVDFFAAHIPGDQELLVIIKLEVSMPPLSHYQVEVYLEGELLLRGVIATFLKEGSD